MSFGVYVHVPWCLSVCGYCDFNTYVPRADEPAGYADTAVAEIALMPDRRPDTIFIGGGTPTLLDPADVGRIIAALDPLPGAEITIEANPETVDERKLAALRDGGRHPRLHRHAERPRARARDARARHTPGAAEARGAGGPPRRLRARLAGPHLRHPGRDRRRLARVPRGRAERGARPRQRLRARRRAGHASARAGPLGQGPHARRGRPRRPLRDRRRDADVSRACTGTRSATGRRRRRRSAGTTSATGAAGTGGRSARARTATSAASASGRTATRTRTPARSRPASCPSRAGRR